MFANKQNHYNHQKKGSIQEVIASSHKNSFSRGEKIRMTPKSHYEGNKFKPVQHQNVVDGAASARPHNHTNKHSMTYQTSKEAKS